MRTRWVGVGALVLLLVALGGSGRSGERGGAKGFVLHAPEGEVLHMGGPTGGKVIVKVDPAKTGAPAMAMGVQRLEGEIPLHVHEHEAELVFVHTGEGEATLGDERARVGPGATIYVPPGTWHGVRRTGDEPAEIVWVVTTEDGRATQLEQFFRAIGAPPGKEIEPLTPEQMADVMAKHGIQVPAE